MRRAFVVAVVLFVAALPACRPRPAAPLPTPPPLATARPALAPPTLPAAAATSPLATALPSEVTPATATPFYTGPLSPPCGVSLAALPDDLAPVTQRALDASVAAALRDQVPAAAWPAVQRLIAAPGTVGLVAFQVGREAEGIYWNADAPMPLASVAKVITLVAYVEAVAAGELQPLEPVPLAELERYYLPGFDLGAHRRALNELRQNGDILSPDSNPSVLLQDVPWMMIRHSSNAAADYLQQRLGQARIEVTARELGLTEATAPCSFLGQFLMMANHTRGQANDRAVLAAYLEDAAGYGRDLALLADAYAADATFRAAETAWRERNRRPAIDTQRYFAARLAPRGTAAGYAALMARLAQNGLSNPDSSYQARRYLEWPNQFAANQELFSNVGYKNGALPGVLTTVYYAYRWNDLAPVVVALFYRDLPQDTYRTWRFDLPHDELARWLLSDPAAIPALAAALR